MDPIKGSLSVVSTFLVVHCIFLLFKEKKRLVEGDELFLKRGNDISLLLGAKSRFENIPIL